MGQKLSLTDVTFSDLSLPILRDDEGLTAGSLALFDMTHSFVTNVGAPANGATIYNIATKEAKALLGAGDDTTLAFSFQNTLTTAEGKFERTTKGALHGVVSDTAQGGHTSSLLIPDLVAERIRANPTRSYAAFIWTNVTRITANNGNMRELLIGASSSFATNNLFNMTIANTLGLGRTSSDRTAGWTGSPPASTGIMQKIAYTWDNAGPFNSLNVNSGKSAVLYRVHIIDLTSAGLTFAQADALDAALYAKLFGVSGRYYGDTWALDPAGTP